MERTKIDPNKPIKEFGHFKVIAVYRKPDNPKGQIVIEESHFWKTNLHRALAELFGQDILKSI